MNDDENMAADLEQMAGKGESGEPLLRALRGIRAGDPAARVTLQSLSDQSSDPDLALKALWMLYEDARSSGDTVGQAAVRSKLGAMFAAAPETALTAGPTGGAALRPIVVQVPAPGSLETGSAPQKADSAPKPDSAPPKGGSAPAAVSATGTQSQAQAASPAPAESSSSAPEAPRSPLLLSVQAGSFLVKENADDLVSELTHRGFTPVLVHEFARGKDRYRVLAGSGLEADEAEGVMKKLSDAGLRGFLVQDK